MANKKKNIQGVVVSNKMDKTVVVKVGIRQSHPRYEKVITRYKKYHAHDEKNRSNIGDFVTLIRTRPLSKLKHWRVAMEKE